MHAIQPLITLAYLAVLGTVMVFRLDYRKRKELDE